MKPAEVTTVARPAAWMGLRRIGTQFLRPHRGVLLIAFVGMLAQAALGLQVLLLQGIAVDRLVAARDPANASATGGALTAVGLLLAAMVACHLARLAAGWKVAATLSRVTLEVVREVTDTMHRKLHRLSMGYFDREPTGRIMARLTSDVGSLLIFLNSGALQLASDLVLAVAISGLLVWLEWRLAIVGLLALPLFAANHRGFAGSIHELSRALREQVASLYAMLSERVSAVRVVRSFAREDEDLAEFDDRIDAQRDVGWSSMKAVAWQAACATLINGLGILGVLTCGAAMVRQGRLTVGELLAFSTLSMQLYQPIVRLTGAQAMLSATLVAIDRIVEVLDEPEARAIGPGPRPSPARRPEGRLVYRDVSFGYFPGRKVLGRIDLEIEPGMTLGVLGTSGSGKSTLLALSPRIYELPAGDGSIELDGLDIRGLDLAYLRRSVALVPQQAMLFEGTLRSNLLYAAHDPARVDIDRALEASDLASWVAKLPMGLDTPVGERGMTLSGGQRQRLALARALAADPSILLLDDCTSALDGPTEARIQAALNELWMGRTHVVVSQKVASVRDADWIIVLDAGRVIEEGTHEDLVRLDGYYATTCRHQAARPHTFTHDHGERLRGSEPNATGERN